MIQSTHLSRMWARGKGHLLSSLCLLGLFHRPSYINLTTAFEYWCCVCFIEGNVELREVK